MMQGLVKATLIKLVALIPGHGGPLRWTDRGLGVPSPTGLSGFCAGR